MNGFAGAALGSTATAAGAAAVVGPTRNAVTDGTVIVVAGVLAPALVAPCNGAEPPSAWMNLVSASS